MIRFRHRPGLALAVWGSLAAAPVPAMAQAPSYQPGPDTLYYETTNPFRMYFVRGADTLGPPRLERSVVRQVWRADAAGPSVALTSLSLNISRARSTETYTLSGAGRVRLIDGKVPDINSRTDLVPRLPREPIRPGLQWSDTLAKEGRGPGGAQFYRVVRSYRVARLGDSLGTRMAWVTGSGRIHFRHSWWVDSTAGSYVWLDAEGPVTEEFVFDITGGRLVDRGFEMTLTGRGGEPRPGGGVDTVSAGLNSAYMDRSITAERANLIGRDLVGLDTTWTFNNGPVLLHTVERGSDTVRSSMARNDGMVGSVTSIFRNSRPVGFQSLWTDSAGALTRFDITVEGRNLRIESNGTLTTDVAPTEILGIADYAMEEHLVPVLLTLPVNTSVRLGIFRPVGREWDRVTAVVRPLQGGRLIILQSEGEKPQFLVVDGGGDLLYVENTDPVKAVRIPAEDGPRGQRLKAILEQLRQPAPAPGSN